MEKLLLQKSKLAHNPDSVFQSAQLIEANYSNYNQISYLFDHKQLSKFLYSKKRTSVAEIEFQKFGKEGKQKNPYLE